MNAYLETVCNIDLQWFPFDQQVCEYNFASASYDIKSVVFELVSASLARYQKNNEFFMENFDVTRKEKNNRCCNDNVSHLIFRMQIQRNPLHTSYSLTLGTSLFTIADIVVFAIPLENGEKIDLSSRALHGAVFLYVGAMMDFPPSEKLPLVAVYVSFCMGLLTLNHFASVLILNWSFSGDEENHLPSWLKATMNLIAKVLLFHERNFEEDLEKKLDKLQSGQCEEKNSASYSDRDNLKPQNVSKFIDQPFQSVSHEGNSNGTTANSGKDLFEQRFLKAVEDLSTFYAEDKIKKMRKNGTPSKSKEEWLRVSRICDRFCLMICFVVFLVFATAVLRSSPFMISFEYHPSKDLPPVNMA